MKNSDDNYPKAFSLVTPHAVPKLMGSINSWAEMKNSDPNQHHSMHQIIKYEDL